MKRFSNRLVLLFFFLDFQSSPPKSTLLNDYSTLIIMGHAFEMNIYARLANTTLQFGNVNGIINLLQTNESKSREGHIRFVERLNTWHLRW